MNKDEFLKELSLLLRNLPSSERQEILFDYQEHFSIGLEEGKTDKEIIEALGSPKSIAKQYDPGYAVNPVEVNSSTTNVVKAIFATIVLGFFNLIFVLGPFLGVVGVLIGLFGASIGVTIAGISISAGMVLNPILYRYISIPIALASNAPATMFLGIGLTAFGLLFTIGNCYLARWLFIGTIKYLKFNLRLIRK
ncbi:MAG: DUF1700 domain-containing protein [Maledivibacter sp.]|jgi:uncharacterized membrane protein|nr:DUF1700 domain-containing protein [Maledivibacter sp.]